MSHFEAQVSTRYQHCHLCQSDSLVDGKCNAPSAVSVTTIEMPWLLKSTEYSSSELDPTSSSSTSNINPIWRPFEKWDDYISTRSSSGFMR